MPCILQALSVRTLATLVRYEFIKTFTQRLPFSHCYTLKSMLTTRSRQLMETALALGCKIALTTGFGKQHLKKHLHGFLLIGDV